MKYDILPDEPFCDSKGYALVGLREEDLENIRNWRNAQLEILRQKEPISKEHQQEYYKAAVLPNFKAEKPTQILFTALLNDRCIGYGGLVHLDWEAKRGEISFLTNPERIPKNFKEDFWAFLSLISPIAFEKLGLHRIYTETYVYRKDLISLLETFGFQFEGRLRDHIYKRQKWEDSIIHGLLSSEYVQEQTNNFGNLLIAGISKKISLIEVIKASAQKTEVFQEIYGSDHDETCIGKFKVDQFWQTPQLYEMTIQEVLDYCLENQIKAIIPANDAELSFYSRHRKRLAEEGIYALVSSKGTVDLCRDKKVFSDVLIGRGYPVIATSLSCAGDRTETCTVSERYSKSKIFTKHNLSPQEAEKFASTLKNPIFQPTIKGERYFIDLYRDRLKNIKGVITRKAVEHSLHEDAIYMTTQKHTKLESVCSELARELEIYGHAVFTAVETPEKEIYIIDCTPRFKAKSFLSIAAGLDSIFWFLQEALGNDLKDFPFIREEHPLTQLQYTSTEILFQ